MHSLKNTSIFSYLTSKFEKYSFTLFLGSVCVILIVLPLFQHGTFIDGLLYKTVAYNYAEGLSTFWSMKFTNTSMAFFCEQPPLYFSLLGSFYKCFDSHYLVDRSVTLLLFVCLFFILYLCIKQLFKKPGNSFLLSFFFLLAIPVFCWSYVNQVIEPLLCLEVAMAIYFFILHLKTKKSTYVLLFGLVLYLLFLTKGFQSCFVVALPFTYMILNRLQRSSLYFFLISSLFLLVSLMVTLKYYQPGMDWFKCYYDARLVLTMDNVGNTTDDHFEIIIRFFTELIICLGFVAILFAYLKFKKKYPLKFVIQNFIANKIAFSLFVASLAGSFPFAISLVQRGFYLLPAFVCFVLAIVVGLKRYWLFFYRFVFNVSAYKFTKLMIGLCVAGTCIYVLMSFSQFKRDEKLLYDLDRILPYLSKNDEVLIEPELWNYVALHSYLYMAKQVSLKQECGNCKFLIVSKKYHNEDLFFIKHKIELSSKELDFYYLPHKK